MVIDIPMITPRQYEEAYRLTIKSNRSNRRTKKKSGLIGLLFAAPKTLIEVFKIYKKVRIACNLTSKFTKEVIADIPEMSDRQLMETHLILERFVRNNSPHILHIDKNAGKYGKRFIPFLLKRIHSMLNKSHDEMVLTEKILKKAAYPDLKRKFTPAEKEELFHRFQSSGHDFSDWEDDDLDIYTETYLK